MSTDGGRGTQLRGVIFFPRKHFIQFAPPCDIIDCLDGDAPVIDGHRVALSHTRDPAKVQSGNYGANYVCESTSVSLIGEKSCASSWPWRRKKSSSLPPAKDDSHTIVMGVNGNTYDGSEKAESCASCTTNDLAPVVEVLHEKFSGLMTTCYAMTTSQSAVDGASKKDCRGGVQGLGNITPSSIGAAKVVAKATPDEKGKLTGLLLRVPTGDVSVVYWAVELENPTTYEDICAKMKCRAEGERKSVLGYIEEPLVSSDSEACLASRTFDAMAGVMLDRTFVKDV